MENHGSEIGLKRLFQKEANEFCQEIIRARMRDNVVPEAPVHGNVETYHIPRNVQVSGLVAGFPCTDSGPA